MTADVSVDFDAERLGWRSFFEDQLTDDERAADWHAARVCRGQARRCHVWSARGTHPLAVALFGEAGLPAVGDWVLLDPTQTQRPRRLERFSALTRQAPGSRFADQVLAANVDTLLIVTACNEDFSAERIERYLVLAAGAGVTPVVVLTKADLTDNASSYVEATQALSDNLRVECLDVRDVEKLKVIEDLCGPGQTVAALGSSGVGKSTLVNGISDADQRIGAVRGDDNKGKHTTTSRSLHRLQAGGVIVDLPGIRELQLAECAGGIEEAFAQVTAVAQGCRFRNCGHDGEPGCAVAQALEAGTLESRQWESYRKLQTEQAVYAKQKAEQVKRQNRRRR